jgi:hypothetical protein
MLSWSYKLLALVVAAGVPGLALAACQPSLPAVGELCSEIPAGGCPTGRGGSCEDKTCRALYTCLNATWHLHETCPKNSGSGGSGGGGPDRDGGPDSGEGGGPCTPFKFDDKGQAENCGPSLENPPDCPSQAAEGCLESACITGCTDFFLCTKQGWVDVGYCDDDGGFHDTQKKD